MKKAFLSILAVISLVSTGRSQSSTWSEVYTTLQTNCIGCHGGGAPQGNLDLSGSSSAVYNALVNQAPTNPAALAKGNLLVDPGYPEKSFLLRKCANSDWDNWYEYELAPAEGNSMPPSPQPSLAHAEIEMIRQWILYGASETDSVVDPMLIQNYYGGLGMAKLPPPPAPDPSEGIQVRLGTFFLPPANEIEFHKKQKLNLDSDLEVISLHPFFNDESHHFILYKFDGATAADYPEGLRNVAEGESSMFDSDMVAAWADPDAIDLPATTAYSWESDIVLDMNYHILNYEQDSILAADVYMNIYTQPTGVAEHEMISRLLPIDWIEAALSQGENIGPSLVIPNDGQPHVFEESFSGFGPILDQIGANWYIWRLGTHTHERGTDFDLFLRNPDGTKGDQIYEGFYNTEYTFNQGFYDWEHPPTRYFEPELLHIPMANGFIFEAEYVNNGSDTLYWGNTTQDEMMLIFVQYTTEPLDQSGTGIGETYGSAVSEIMAMPNPTNDNSTVRFELEEPAEVDIALLDVTGRVVFQESKGELGIGTHTQLIDMSGLRSGLYLLNLNVGADRAVVRLVKE